MFCRYRRPGWLNWRCIAGAAEVIHCLCRKERQIYLTLRGLCPHSNIDSYWVPRNEKTSRLIYVGITSSQINFNYQANQWELDVVGKKEGTVGRADTGFESLMLGRTSWMIERDSPACNNMKPYNITLKLSGCGEEEFTCSDGQCIRRLFFQFTVQKIEVRNERLQITLLLTHSQLFPHTSKSCVVNFAFFAWNPFNQPRVVGWYHWNPQNRPKGALFRGYKKSSIFLKNQLKF